MEVNTYLCQCVKIYTLASELNMKAINNVAEAYEKRSYC